MRRSLLAPDVPTFTEAGSPGFEPTAWAGVVVPKGDFVGQPELLAEAAPTCVDWMQQRRLII